MSTIYNVQTFDKLPLSANVPSTGSQLINKTYGDTTYQADASAVKLNGTNAWTGTNSYDVNLPTSTVTPSADAELITKIFADSTYVAITGAPTLAGDNDWLGLNTFNVSLPTSTVTPAADEDLVTKVFSDTTYAQLGAANEFTDVNTFDANPLFPTGAAASYVATSTDTSGAWTWEVSASPFSSATVATTDATPTTLASYTLPSNGVVTFTGTVSAANSLYTDACGGTFSATAVSVAGVVTLVSTALVAVNSSTSAVFNVIVSGTKVIVQVTGIAATTYNWKAIYQVAAN